jgi:quercetin dioxygenase-like cupin family protein
MSVLSAAVATTHETHGARFISYVNPTMGSTELCAWKLEIPADTTGVPHTVTHEEVLFVLNGQLLVHLDDAPPQRARAGDAIFVPAGTRFSVDNPAEQPAAAWVSTSVGLKAELDDGSRIAPPWTR